MENRLTGRWLLGKVTKGHPVSMGGRIQKRVCEIIFCIFTSKTSWFDGLGGMSVFVFLISPGGDSSYYTIYIQWQMMVITSVTFERKHSSYSFKNSFFRVFRVLRGFRTGYF